MRRRKELALIIAIAVAVFLLGGCGKKKFEIPELEDPVISNMSLTPVEYGIVGGELFECMVTAMDKCYFWETECVIKEICVQRGQYVEAGTVLACANTDIAKKVVDDLKATIRYSNAQFEIDEELYLYDHQQMELDLVLAKDAGQSKLAEEIEKQMQILEENHRFDVMYHEYEISGYEKQVKEKQQLIEDGKLVATTSGYVTYIKNLTKGFDFFPGENVVVLTDYDQLYLESSLTTGASVSKKTTSKAYYVYYAGERYPLTEINYTKEEEVVAENRDKKLLRRFALDNIDFPLTVGSYLQGVKLEDEGNEKSEVLRVLQNALMSDDSGYFVYVVENGVKEQRYVEVGRKDGEYAQICSGLKEGDLVSYSSKEPMPIHYDEYQVEAVDCFETDSVTVDQEKFLSKTERADYNGKILDLFYAKGDQVKKGDLVCTIQTDNGSARLTELATGLNGLTRDHDMLEKAFAEQVKGINEEKIAYANMRENELYAIWHPINEEDGADESSEEQEEDEDGGLDAEERQRLIDAVERKYGFLFKKSDISLTQVEAQKKKAQLTYEYEYGLTKAEYDKLRVQNDGKGVISVYAQVDGFVDDVTIKTGKTVFEGDVLFNIYEKREEVLGFKPKYMMLPGQKVSLVDKETGEKTETYIVANDGSEKPYITEVNGTLHVTEDKESTSYTYVKAPDGFDLNTLGGYKIEYPLTLFTKVIVLPKDTVKTEKREGEDDPYYYVWRVEDKKLVKQYVDGFVRVNTTSKDKNGYECVYEGLREGDIIALEQ